ncbi:MAG: glycosyltransferase family 2 protein, partial [Halobacteriota archaeon]
EAIESVLGQDFEDLELIIVDDASTDASRQIIESYQERDHRVRAIFHERNLGVPKVANDGIEAARGTYIAQTDSDDVWMKDKLSRQLDALAHDDNQIVWSEGELIDDKGQSLAKTFSELHYSVSRKKSGNLFEELLKGNYIFGTSLMYKRANLGNIRYDEDLVTASDYKFVLDLARKYKFHYIPIPLAQYRIHAGSTWKKRRQAFADEILVRQKALQQYSNEISDTTKADMYWTIAMYYVKLGDYRGVRHTYLQAIKSNPWSRSTPDYVAGIFKTVLRDFL